jgi:hypothetical protein
MAGAPVLLSPELTLQVCAKIFAGAYKAATAVLVVTVPAGWLAIVRLRVFESKLLVDASINVPNSAGLAPTL